MRRQALGEQSSGRDRVRSQIEKLLALDLSHATRCRVVEGGFKLRTRTAIRPGTMQAEHVPVEVVYEVGRAGEESWLVRSQFTGKEVFREIVCSDVTGLSFSCRRGETLEHDNLSLEPGDVVEFQITFFRDGRENQESFSIPVQ